MPISNPLHTPAVLHFIAALAPRRILDIGVGMGTYGYLARQLLDIANERVEKNRWQVVIDGVEIFEGYRNPTWDYAYDSVKIGDIRTMLDSLGKYDLILCNDVLEHFQLEAAKKLMNRLFEHGSTLLITTPNGVFPQGIWGGNEAEIHLCSIRQSDMPHCVTYLKTGVTNCYLCTNNPANAAIIKKAAESCPRFYLKRPMLAKRVFRKLIKMCSR